MTDTSVVDEFTISSDFTVQLHQCMGDDASIVQAAKVSTLGLEAADQDASQALIDFLLRNRHGTPFEHNSMTFLIEAPIFVFREFQRHRIGWSYSESSARYRKLEPKFYVPFRDRPLVQVGKPGAYDFVPGDPDQYLTTSVELTGAYSNAYKAYLSMLEAGVAKEVARCCLPVGIYSSMFATCNARSLMSFLSLRTKEPESLFPSYPQWEIEQVARGMEDVFAHLFPLTYNSWCNRGRVAP